MTSVSAYSPWRWPRASSGGRPAGSFPKLLFLLAACLAAALPNRAEGQTQPATQAQPITLKDAIATTLARNRAIQIERINPEIARLALSGAEGYYDPLFFSRFQAGEENDTGGYDPVDLSRDAVDYSADVQTAEAGIRGFLPSGMSYSLSGRYAHTDGTRDEDFFDSYRLGTLASVRQPLLRNFWTDQGRTLIRVNKKLVAISHLAVSYVVLDTINQVQQAYYELLFALENLDVRKRLLASKESTLKGIQRQVEVGTLTVLEEKLAESEVARVQAELTASSNNVWIAENILRTLMGHNITNWSSGPLMPVDKLLIVPERLELAESWQMGLLQRPDLRQMQEDLDRSDIQLRFYRNQLYPSLDLVASYGRKGASALESTNPPTASFSDAWEQVRNGDAPNYVVGVVLSTPLTRARERANFRAGKQLKEQAQLRLKQKEELVLREVSDAIHGARSARDRAAATRLARETARAALDAEEQKLAAGKSSLFIVFQLQGSLADAEAAEVRARADYNKALSQLHFAEGTLLEHANLALEVK